MNMKKHQAGFTLIEMIMVIVITGIIAGMVAIFIRSPIDGYFNTVRRAALTEEADFALRFVARDLQAALPNSITCGVFGSDKGMRFLSVRSGGRFREAPTNANAGVPLAFGTAATTFDVIGSDANSTLFDARGNAVDGSSSRVIVGNLSNGVSSCYNYDSVSGFVNNAPSLASLAASNVAFVNTSYPGECQLTSATIADTGAFPNQINGREFGRFYVTDSTLVEYVCENGKGLKRNGSLLIDPSHVQACEVACDQTKPRIQLVTFNLTLKDRDNESVMLLRRVTIVNRP